MGLKLSDVLSVLCLLQFLSTIYAFTENQFGTKQHLPFLSGRAFLQPSKLALKNAIVPSHRKHLTAVGDPRLYDNECFGKFNSKLRYQNVTEFAFLALSSCRMDYRVLKRIFNSCTLTWIIDDEALDMIKNDLQSVIECSEAGEIVLFLVDHVIHPTRTMIIPHKLKFTNEGSAVTDESGKTTYPTSFTCPSTSPLLVIKFNVVDCDEVATVVSIEISECSDVILPKALGLKDTLFWNNTAAKNQNVIHANSISCGSFFLQNIQFINNTCKGKACITLPQKSVITSTSFLANKENSHLAETAIFNVPSEANAVFQDVTGEKNEVRMFYVNKSATVFVKESSFKNNTIQLSSSSSIEGKKGAVLYALSDASVEFVKSSFLGNDAYEGGAIATFGSELKISNSAFNWNLVKENGGAISLHAGTKLSISDSQFQGNGGDLGGAVEADEGSSVSVERTNFFENFADKGAAIVVISASSLDAKTCKFSRNKADISGAIEASGSSSFILTDTIFTNNHANFGGALYVSESSKGEVTSCAFTENQGVQNGGAAEVCKDSSLKISRSIFKGNEGDWGGAVALLENSELWTSETKFEENKAISGGAFYVINFSSLHCNESWFNRNTADEDGGAVTIHNGVAAEITNTCFNWNTASQRGGAVFSEADSKSLFKESNFTSNVAKSGGGMFLVDSESSLTASYMVANHASESGETIYSIHSTLIINDNEIKQKKDPVELHFHETLPLNPIIVT